MGSLSGLLVTVRSAKQGAEMMTNKLSAEYGREISSLRINPCLLYTSDAADE